MWKSYAETLLMFRPRMQTAFLRAAPRAFDPWSLARCIGGFLGRRMGPAPFDKGWLKPPLKPP